MKSLNDCVKEYNKQLHIGDIQIAYRGIIEYMMELKTYLKNKYSDLSVSGNLYQGYMDMTYFSLNIKFLKDRKLKIAIVLIHDETKFEIWLSGINKQIQEKYWNRFKTKDIKRYRMPVSLKNADSIIEHTITDNPDFNNLNALTRQIEAETLKFIDDMCFLFENE